MSIMTKLVLLGLALVLLASSVDAHGWMSSPSPRGQYTTPKKTAADEIKPSTTDPTDPNFVCRSDPEMPKANWLPLRAGQSQSITLEITAKHVGDCFVYLTYDGDKAMTEMKWFKIWEQHACKDADKYDIPIPSYLPSGDHVIFRWEWYALHIWPTVEYYAQCVDATMTGVTGGVLPSPQVTMPGHLPKSVEPYTMYWDPFNGAANSFFTGPALATIDGQPSTTKPTSAPVTSAPVTAAPSTTKPTSAPTTAPTQKATSAPSTTKPTSAPPTAPTQKATDKPTTAPTQKATSAPSTTKPTSAPATAAPGGSNFVKFSALPDSSKYWFAGRILGHRANEVTKVEIKDSGSYSSNWVAAKNEWSDVWTFSPDNIEGFTFPLTVKASLASGSSLSFIANRLPAGTVDSGLTFP